MSQNNNGQGPLNEDGKNVEHLNNLKTALGEEREKRKQIKQEFEDYKNSQNERIAASEQKFKEMQEKFNSIINPGEGDGNKDGEGDGEKSTPTNDFDEKLNAVNSIIEEQGNKIKAYEEFFNKQKEKEVEDVENMINSIPEEEQEFVRQVIEGKDYETQKMLINKLDTMAKGPNFDPSIAKKKQQQDTNEQKLKDEYEKLTQKKKDEGQLTPSETGRRIELRNKILNLK